MNYLHSYPPTSSMVSVPAPQAPFASRFPQDSRNSLSTASTIASGSTNTQQNTSSFGQLSIGAPNTSTVCILPSPKSADSFYCSSQIQTILRPELHYLIPVNPNELKGLRLEMNREGSLTVKDTPQKVEVPKQSLGQQLDKYLVQKDLSLQKKTIFRNRRDDLYFKTLIRDVRKFLIEDFNHFSGLKNKKQRFTTQSFVESLTSYATFINQKLGYQFGDVTPLVQNLGPFINQKLISKAGPVLSGRCDVIYNMLYNFTKEKLSLFSEKNSPLSLLFKYYCLVSEDASGSNNRIQKHKTMKQNQQAYYIVYSTLKDYCHSQS